MTTPLQNHALAVEQAILALIPQKIAYRGTLVPASPATYLAQVLAYLETQVPEAAGFAERSFRLSHIHAWLTARTTPWDMDATFRAVEPPPEPSPISTQTVPQQAVLAPPTAAPKVAEKPAATPEAPNPYADPQDQTSYETLRGLKRHVTMAHKTDWKAWCGQYGLDPETGLKPGATASVAAAAPAPTTPPPVSPSVPPMLPAQAPTTPLAAIATAPAAPVGARSTPPAAPAMPWQPGAVGEAIAFVPQPEAEMPTPPPAVAVAYAPFAPMSAPIAAASAAAVTALMAEMTSPSAQQPVQAPIAAPPGGYIKLEPITPVSQPVPAATSAEGRAQLAAMLGGAVDLFVCRLLDLSSLDVQGRTDANQLALLAEAQARTELRIQDLAQAAYAAGKQAAQRCFADLLTKHPSVYILQNGYDYILPDGYLPILLARTTRAHIATDQGRSINELRLA